MIDSEWTVVAGAWIADAGRRPEAQAMLPASASLWVAIQRREARACGGANSESLI